MAKDVRTGEGAAEEGDPGLHSSLGSGDFAVCEADVDVDRRS